jgi:hypothetical protein
MREHVAMRRAAWVWLAAALLAASCTGGSTSSSPPSASRFSLQVASTDLSTGSPQRVQVGVFSSSDQGVELLTGGTIPITLTPADGGQPIDADATYVPAPGTPSPASPGLTPPSEARGVYQLNDIMFPKIGVWNAQLSFNTNGQPVDLTASFGVSDASALPAPGDRAFHTENLTMADAKHDPQAVDSRAMDGAPVPDPELHRDTIADALDAHRPILVLFATPVYCVSQFCGPSTDALERLAKIGPSDAAYIHIEIWAKPPPPTGKTFKPTDAAAQWLYRNQDLTEPWLFLIGRDGVIVDRWGPLFDPHEVLQELEKADR